MVRIRLGSVDNSASPQQDTRELHEPEIATSTCVKPRQDPTEMKCFMLLIKHSTSCRSRDHQRPSSRGCLARRHAASLPTEACGALRRNPRSFVQCSSVRRTVVICQPYQHVVKAQQNLVTVLPTRLQQNQGVWVSTWVSNIQKTTRRVASGLRSMASNALSKLAGEPRIRLATT